MLSNAPANKPTFVDASLNAPLDVILNLIQDPTTTTPAVILNLIQDLPIFSQEKTRVNKKTKKEE